jgi:FkbM family methyltransferase
MTEATHHFDMVNRFCQRLAEEGPAYTFRRAIWRFHYENFQRIRRTRAKCNGNPPGLVRFLGKEFELHSSMQGVSEELVLFGSHEPLGTELYLQQLSPGNHVLDIGSNIGYWLLMAEQAIGESGRILGFEPAPEVYSILQRNIAKSGHKNIYVLPCAVGAANETAQFYQSEVPNWGSLIQQDSLRQTRTLAVQVRKLEDIVGEFPDFHPNALRMDLEGAELMVLESAKEMLARYKPCLFVEFHPAVLGWPAIRQTLVWLQDLGYSSGTLIQRTWDQPWISKWIRKRRCWSGPIETLIQRIESPKDPISDSTFSLILQGSRKRSQAKFPFTSEK